MHIPSVARAAIRILDAVQSGDNARLRASLRFACPDLDAVPADAAERWDLLDAIASQMRRRPPGDSTGLEVHLSLLRHLVGSQRQQTI